MITVTGLTAERMKAIEAASVISGRISGDNLILTTYGGSEVDAGNVRGALGPTGPTGISLWLTTQPITTNITDNIVPEAVPGKNLQLGDLVMSTNASTLGYFGRVVTLNAKTNASIAYVSNLRGPTGGSQEEFDNMFEVGMSDWTSANTMSESEAVTGTVTTPKLFSAAAFRGAVRRLVTGSASVAVSSIGQSLAKASNAEAARQVIGVMDSTTTQQSLDKKPNSDEVKDIKPITLAAYNSLTTKSPTTLYLITG